MFRGHVKVRKSSYLSIGLVPFCIILIPLWFYLSMKVLARQIDPNGIETWKILIVDTWVIKKAKEKEKLMMLVQHWCRIGSYTKIYKLQNQVILLVESTNFKPNDFILGFVQSMKKLVVVLMCHHYLAKSWQFPEKLLLVEKPIFNLGSNLEV